MVDLQKNKAVAVQCILGRVKAFDFGIQPHACGLSPYEVTLALPPT